MSWNRFFAVCGGIGVLITMGGLGLDLLPGSYPGISLPQLMMILSGAAITGISLILRNASIRNRLSTNLLRNLLISGVVLIVIVILLEVMLTVFNRPIRYDPDILRVKLTSTSFWECDEHGCRYNYQVVQSACADGKLTDLHCVINQAGFHDTQEFIADDTLDSASLRVFVMGDSFTFGASAKLGSSWVETIEARTPDAVIWNTGMPGTGGNQALEVLKQYAPAMQPDLLVLGFYVNDFEDNTYPLDQFFRGTIDGKGFAFIRQYQMYPDYSVHKITDSTHLIYRFYGVEPPANAVEQFLGGTRLGTLILNVNDAVHRTLNNVENSSFDHEVRITRQLLQDIQSIAGELGSDFMIVLIPEKQDLTRPTKRYTTAVQLFDELNIPYIDPLEYLQLATDYAPEPNVHWSTAGHEKVGAIIATCIEQYIQSGNLSDCESVTMP